MEDEPILDSELRRAIDACRPAALDPNGSDWKLPETARAAGQIACDRKLAEIRERVEKLDTAFASACQQVPVPEGLANRLLAALEVAPTGGPVGSVDGAEMAASRRVRFTLRGPGAAVSSWRRPRLGRRPHNRRQLVLGRRRVVGGALGIAAVLVGFGLWFGFHPPPLEYEDALAQALDYYEHDSRERGTPLTDDDSPLVSFPPFPSVKMDRWTTVWRPLDETLWGRTGVAYDLRSGGVRATLYVVRDSAWAVRLKRLPPTPGPPNQTGGRSATIWSSGGLVYVLVVNGNAKTFRRFVQENVA